MPIELATVTRPEDLRDIFRLRHQVFVQEESDLAGTDDALIYDSFDAFPTTRHVLAREDGAPLAAMRVTEHSGVGLPWDNVTRPRRSLESGNERTGSIGMVVCRRDHRRRAGLVMGLLRRGLQALRSCGVGPIVVAVNDDFARTVARMGLEVIGEPFGEPGIRSLVVPMAGHLNGFAAPFGEEFSDDELGGFTDPGQRLLYRRGEVVREAGVHAATAFIVTRGAVRLAGDDGDRIRRIGDCVGLAELITGRTSRRTAIAAERATELAPLRKTALSQTDLPAVASALARQALDEDTWVAADPAAVQRAA